MSIHHIECKCALVFTPGMNVKDVWCSVCECRRSKSRIWSECRHCYENMLKKRHSEADSRCIRPRLHPILCQWYSEPLSVLDPRGERIWPICPFHVASNVKNNVALRGT
jgi:hypothetical protein